MSVCNAHARLVIYGLFQSIIIICIISGAIASDESIRVCPSVKSRRGWVWSVNPLAADHWMMDISMRITGRLKNGADGMVSPLLLL